MTRRQLNIIRRMLDGDVYYSQGSPRMTARECEELNNLGCQIQSASVHGADTSYGRCYYPIDRPRLFEILSQHIATPQQQGEASSAE